MKKFLLATALISLSAGAANAQVNFGQPAYQAYEPAPVIVEHPYLPAHYNGRDRHREGREWRYSHEYHDRDERHDNGRHLGQIKHDDHYR